MVTPPGRTRVEDDLQFNSDYKYNNRPGHRQRVLSKLIMYNILVYIVHRLATHTCHSSRRIEMR